MDPVTASLIVARQLRLPLAFSFGFLLAAAFVLSWA